MLQLNLKTKNKPELGILIPRGKKKCVNWLLGQWHLLFYYLVCWVVVLLAIAEAVLIVESFMIDIFEVTE